MSRIVRGESQEVKNLRPETKSAVKDFARPHFRAIHAADTLTLEEADQKIKEAIQKSKLQALQEAEAKMKQPVQTAIQNVESLLDEISRFRRDLFKEAEQEILEMVGKICKRVLASELKTQPELLLNVVQKGLDYLEKLK